MRKTREIEENRVEIKNQEQSSYRQIVKSTSIFGGVQVFNIIIGIIRSKIIAVLLGPLGMGISGLLTTTTGFISGLTNFGLSTSAVKNISEANSEGDKERIAIVVSVFRRWVWITGLLGMIVTISLSSLLSKLTFENNEYTTAFLLISVTLLINQISSGQSVLLQGMRQIKYLAQSGMIGGVLGLATTIPLYYFYGVKGIVPAIIIASFTTLFLTWFYTRKIGLKKVKVNKSLVWKEGKGMLKMGFMISLNGMIVNTVSYIVRIFISNYGGVEQVGLYNAGFAIINTYVGMIFTAMSTDYYPRLSAVASCNKESRNIINQQAETAILIIAPIISIFIVFINWFVMILYSKKFIDINDMILYAGIGMLFKASSWAVAFIFLAKGDGKIFFQNELIANLYTLGLNILGYVFYGLTGLGISFLVGYILYLTQVIIVCKRKYEFKFNLEYYKMFLLQLILAISCLLAVKTITTPYSYILGILLITISVTYSWKELDKRIGMKTVIKKVLKRQ